MSREDYWLECLSQAADEAGIVLDSHILKVLAKAAEDGHDHYSMAFYAPSSSELYQPRIDKLERDLKAEREKVFCKTCGGTGRLIESFGTRSSDSQCYKCNGNGKI
jgi:hypothetical protein